MPNDDSGADLSALRRKITELVARNSVAMVQNTIDAVNEDGQYQAIKYLFEMIGLYPASAKEESPAQDSLARTLLNHLGLSEVTEQQHAAAKVTTQHPVKSK